MRSNYAFTLLELLISLSIVGILSAIAIPRYADYKRKAFDARAQADLRNAAIAEESYFIDSERYLSCIGLECRALPGFVALSQGVELELEGTETGFLGESRHRQGSGRVYVWNSSEGGMR